MAQVPEIPPTEEQKKLSPGSDASLPKSKINHVALMWKARASYLGTLLAATVDEGPAPTQTIIDAMRRASRCLEGALEIDPLIFSPSRAIRDLTEAEDSLH